MTWNSAAVSQYQQTPGFARRHGQLTPKTGSVRPAGGVQDSVAVFLLAMNRLSPGRPVRARQKGMGGHGSGLRVGWLAGAEACGFGSGSRVPCRCRCHDRLYVRLAPPGYSEGDRWGGSLWRARAPPRRAVPVPVPAVPCIWRRACAAGASTDGPETPGLGWCQDGNGMEGEPSDSKLGISLWLAGCLAPPQPTAITQPCAQGTSHGGLGEEPNQPKHPHCI